MTWYNTSPSHMRAERDTEQMRRSWESWWHGRTGQRCAWEQDTQGAIREVYKDKHRKTSTGCAVLVFCPGGVWYDTHHEWDSYPFDCLLPCAPDGDFEERQKTGKWLRTYTGVHVAQRLERRAFDILLASSHPFCQQHRRAQQRMLLDWQQSIPPEDRWPRDRVEESLRLMAGPDVPITIQELQ